MKRFISHLAINITLVSFAIGRSTTAEQPANSTSEQEVRQMKEKYRTVILQRDITTLEKIWADDYVFVNAAGNVLSKTANTKSGATTLDSISRSTRFDWVPILPALPHQPRSSKRTDHL